MTKKKKKKARHYFTSETEQAIVDYCSTDDQKKRTQLYQEQIQPAFNEMVDKIVYTYKFTNLPNIDYLKDDCKIWLTTILSKFNPDKGTKAFSYFSVVTKNWFTHKAKKNSQKFKREVEYDSMVREIDSISQENQRDLLEEKSEQQFWKFLLLEVDGWKKLNLKENEQKVLDAVIILLNDIEKIEIFNKKAVYFYLREITGLNTKQIVSCLNKMRSRYRMFKDKWNNGEFN